MSIEKRIEEIQDRLIGIYPGPWIKTDNDQFVNDGDGHSIYDVASCYDAEDEKRQVATMEFIANCREDIPWLIRQLKKNICLGQLSEMK